MGALKNWFKFSKMEKLVGGYALGHYRKSEDMALIYNDEILEPYVSSVSNNMRTKENENQSRYLFLAKKKDGGYFLVDRMGKVIFDSLKSAVNNGILKKDTFVYDEVKQERLHHYIMNYAGDEVLIIPQIGFVSKEYKKIGPINQNGVREVVETAVSFKLNKTDGYKHGCWYINAKGERITPRILSKCAAGDYQIFYIHEDNECFDYIYEYVEERGDFVRQSKGYPFINYINGRFIATDKYSNQFLIDEFGKKKSDYLSSYHVLSDGTVVGLIHNKANSAIVYDSDYKEIYTLDNPKVDAKAGVVSGIDCEDQEKRCYMFGLNKNRVFLVNADCAELLIKILKGSEPPRYYTAALLKNISQEDLEQALLCYECIIKDNLVNDPNNEYLQNLVKTARVTFLKELTESAREVVRATREQLKKVNQEQEELLTSSKLLKQKGSALQALVDDIEKE